MRGQAFLGLWDWGTQDNSELSVSGGVSLPLSILVLEVLGIFKEKIPQRGPVLSGKWCTATFSRRRQRPFSAEEDILPPWLGKSELGVRKKVRVNIQNNFPEIKEDLNVLTEREIDTEWSTLRQILINEYLTLKKKNSKGVQ